MTNLFSSKTNFSAGELSTDLLGRVDLTAYANGAMCLKNVFLEPTGGIHRRPGLKYVADLGGFGRSNYIQRCMTNADSLRADLRHRQDSP